jgi:exopolysaccharide biosynthesis operon protein EpsL
LLLIGGTATAWAQEEPTLKFSAAYARKTESNLFSLSAAGLASRPDLNVAEQVGVTTLGVKFNKAYSLQRIELDLNLVDYQYQTFSDLSFTAKNYNAAWRWAFTPRLTGNLTSDRRQTLNSFADNPGSTARNQRTNSNTGFDAVYEINGPWRALAGVSRSSQTNQQVLLAEGDYTNNAANVGARYVFASGSNLSYIVRTNSGSYSNRALSTTNLYDDGYTQTDNEVRLRWLLTGKSTADFSATHVSRSHPHFAQRDYSGLNTTVNVNWGITAKTSLSAGWARELASYQTNTSNYSQTNRLTLGPVWQTSPKTVLRLNHTAAQVDYLDAPGGAPVTNPRSDTTRDTSLSLAWQPNERFTLSTSLQKTKRSSNQTNLDYDNNSATLSAQYSY